jgi:hypothetical protein
MTKVQIIHQLETLIEDAESHRNSDGTLDDVFQNDVEALRFAVVEIKRKAVKDFCEGYRKCEDCPLNRADIGCFAYAHMYANENELDAILKAIKTVGGEKVE